MTQSHSSERFHALDATRAFALLLGVVFHAAWSFVPRATGAPIVDVSGHVFFDWFFFASHTFRMQLFFLIAGFFARMLYQKRGFAGFVKHRLSRIGVPFVVGWFILCPLLIAVWTWGGNVSGANLVPVPIATLLGLMILKGMMFVPGSQGGMFSLIHLWFLYYLLWLYVLALVVRFLFTRAVPESVRLRHHADRAVAHTANSPWSLIWLTFLTGIFLWRMEGWFGVDTPLDSFALSVPVLVLYGSFFGLGWLIHRQPPLLQGFARHWKWEIPAGIMLSIALFGVSARLARFGVLDAEVYPWLSPGQIVNWPRFLAELKSAETARSARPARMSLWNHLPEAARAVILKMPDDPRPEAKAGVCDAINGVLFLPGLFVAGPTPNEDRPSPAEAKRWSGENRKTLDDLFDAVMIRNPRQLPWYAPVKLAYSLGYALVMWLLTFGTLGFFQAKFISHSPAWRYVADSAYWIYLVHMPLVPFLQVWMGRWPIPTAPKFLLLNLLAFALLVASYHYLVRSSFIGQILNGQRYPFTRWPARSARDPGASQTKPAAQILARDQS